MLGSHAAGYRGFHTGGHVNRPEYHVLCVDVRRAGALVLALAAGALATSGVACKRARTEGERVLGAYAGGEVTVADLERESGKLPPSLRARIGTPEGEREMVSAIIDRRLLALEARSRKLQETPEIQREVKDLEERLAIQALLAAEEAKAGTPTEPELKAWYDAHQSELAQPERVRFARVLAAVKPDSSPSERAKAQGRAERFLQRLQRGEAFAKVAVEGDGPERERAGEVGLLARGVGRDRRLEAAVFALSPVGALSQVVECDEGFAVLRLEERREGRVPRFEEVRGDVANRMAPQRKRKVFDELLGRLRTSGGVKLVVQQAR